MDLVRLESKQEHAFGLQSGVSRLRQDNFVSDFKLNVGEKCIPAHKAVLASISVFFRGLFTHDMEVLKKGSVDLKGVTSEAIDRSMDFMYSGTAEINIVNVQAVAYAAEMLQLGGLSQLCSSFLRFNLSLQNCLLGKALADLYNWKDLKVISERFILDNFDSLMSSGIVTSLEVEDLKLCLKSLDLHFATSWKVVLDWVKTSPEERCGELLGLVEQVGIERFAIDFILDTVLTEPLVMQTSSVRNLVTNATLGNIQALKSSLSIQNCFKLKKMLSQSAGLSNSEDANMAILQFLIGNLNSMPECNGWKELSLEELKFLVGTEYTKAPLETTKWHLITGWVKHREERKKYFPELFKLIKLRRLPFDFLESDVKSEQLMQEFPECKKGLPTSTDAQTSKERDVVESDAQIAVVVEMEEGSCFMEFFLPRFGAFSRKKFPLPRREKAIPPRKVVWDSGSLILIEERCIWKWVENENQVGWVEKGKIEQKITHDTNVVCTRELLFLINSGKAIQYDLKSEKQSSFPSCGLDEGFCMTTTEGKLYAMGGLRTSRDAKILCLEDQDPEGQFQEEVWESIPMMRQRRVNASAAGIRNGVYVMGGISVGQDLASLEFFSEETNNWTMMAGMLTPRSHFEALSFGNKIYAVGGDHFASLGNKSVQSIEVYDVESNNWQIVATRLTLSKNISVCEAHLQSVTKAGISLARTERRVQANSVVVTSEQLVKNLGGATLIFGDKTFIRQSQVDMFVDNHPDDIPSAYEPVTARFRCLTIEEFLKPAELELLSSLTDSSGKLVTILQKLPFGDEWKAVGLTKPVGNKVKLQINASCGLIGVVLKSEQRPIGAKDRIIKAPLPLSQEDMSNRLQLFRFRDPPLRRHNFNIHASSPSLVNIGKRTSNLSRLVQRRQRYGGDPWVKFEDNVKKMSDMLASNPKELHEAKPGTSHLTHEQTAVNESSTGVEELERENLAKKNWSEEYDAVAAEFQEYIKKPVESSKTIGPTGGEIRLCGCALEFPDGALKEDKELSVSVDNNPANFPPNLEPISVILGFKPSMQFDKPVTVSMKTWFRALEGQTVPVVVSSRRRGSDWKKVDEVTIGDTNEVKFTVRHFCEIGLGLAPEHKDKGEYVLSNAIFIHREVGWIHSFFYRDDDKSDRDVRDAMRSENCVVFSTPPPLRISGKREQKVSIKAKLTAPVNTDLTIGLDKPEFQIKDILQYKQHNIVFIPSPDLGEYNGVVKGEYIAELEARRSRKKQEAAKRLLVRKWPATLDPEGTPIIRQNITAGFAATGHAQVSYSAKDSTTTVASQ